MFLYTFTILITFYDGFFGLLGLSSFLFSFSFHHFLVWFRVKALSSVNLNLVSVDLQGSDASKQ